MIEIGRLVVFVRNNGNGQATGAFDPRGGAAIGNHPEGPILYAEPPLEQEIEKWNGATDIGDLNFEETPAQSGILDGLVVWEGWIEWSAGDAADSEPEMHGGWRKLSHWEMCRVREGLPPWGGR